jgi:NDP-sugar pyrophosphorylase family protein
MKTILICPSERTGVPFLGKNAPLSNVPMMGHGLLEYWLSFLACARAKEVLVLAQDRAEQVKALVEDGSRWGLKVEVSAKARELTPEEAQSQYEPDSTVYVLDHFPEMPEKPLFTSYADWFAAMQEWMPRAKTPDRAGVREIQPGVWAGLHCNISKAAYLQAPCWLGDHVYIGSAATIGPGSILEDGAFVEPKARIINSYVGPDTFVGRYVQVKDSVACGDTLINWQTSLEIKVPDSFLMCSLRPAAPKQKSGSASWLDRIADFWNDLEAAEQAVQQPVLVGAEKPEFGNRRSRA